jgi:acyl-coenzyme A thioesterase PaaI-like protein
VKEEWVLGEKAIQDLLPDHSCFGCGPDNAHGLQIKSYWNDETGEAICTFYPKPHHLAGPAILNGGIIATIMDCHSVNTAMAATYLAEGRPIGAEPPVWCVTGSMELKYRKPTPLEGPLVLRARIVQTDGRKTTVACSLCANDVETAAAQVLAVRVDWRQSQEPGQKA